MNIVHTNLPTNQQISYEKKKTDVNRNDECKPLNRTREKKQERIEEQLREHFRVNLAKSSRAVYLVKKYL